MRAINKVLAYVMQILFSYWQVNCPAALWSSLNSPADSIERPRPRREPLIHPPTAWPTQAPPPLQGSLSPDVFSPSEQRPTGGQLGPLRVLDRVAGPGKCDRARDMLALAESLFTVLSSSQARSLAQRRQARNLKEGKCWPILALLASRASAVIVELSC
jgi:hypothetical protein